MSGTITYTRGGARGVHRRARLHPALSDPGIGRASDTSGASMRMRDLLARARDELRYEPIEKRVRATAGDETIVDTTRAVLLWEPRRICPIYAVPADDIRAELVAGAGERRRRPGAPAPGDPVQRAHGRRASRSRSRATAGYRLADLPGYVAVDFEAFDWREEDEPVQGHPRDPFHRVDVQRTSRPAADRARRRTRGREHPRAPRLRDRAPDALLRPPRGRPRARCGRASCARTARTRARRPTGPSTAART